MTDQVQKLNEIFNKKQQRDNEVIANVKESITKVFPDPAQSEIIGDLYEQLFKITSQTQELNHGSAFLSSYIEAFYTFLVGEGKIISEDDYRNAAAEAYKQSLEFITNLEKQEETNG